MKRATLFISQVTCRTQIDCIQAEFEYIPFSRTKTNGPTPKCLRSFNETRFLCFTWMNVATSVRRQRRGLFIAERFRPGSMFSKNSKCRARVCMCMCKRGVGMPQFFISTLFILQPKTESSKSLSPS